MESDNVILSLGDTDLRELAASLRSGRLNFPTSEMAVAQIIGASESSVVSASLAEWAGQGLSASQIAWALELLLQSRQRLRTSMDQIDVVLTGPEVKGVTVRDTSAVVHEMFAQATQSVMVAGYAVHQGQRIFKALADRMVSIPHLHVELFLEIHPDNSSDIVSRFANRFKSQQWPSNRPYPKVFYFPEALKPGEQRASLHAKCVVVDTRIALVSSANFTEAAHERNLEVGLLVRSHSRAAQLVQYFHTLVRDGRLIRLM